MNKKRRRVQDEGSFDPDRHNGKFTWTSRLKDVGWFLKSQGEDARQMLMRTWQISCDFVSDLKRGPRR